MSVKPDLNYWITLIDEKFREKNYQAARDFILQGLVSFPNHSILLDRLFIVDQRWCSPIAGNRIHMTIPEESDLPYLQQCFSNEEFMEQLLPMGRRNQSTESMLVVLRHNKFPVAQSRTVHWIIKKDEQADQSQESLISSLKPIGLASLVDIQIAHRRAELLIGIPNEDDRKQAAAVIGTLLILDFAFNQIGLHKLTTMVIANNQHSQKSTTSIGFLQEGLRQQHLRDPKSRQWLDCYENGLTEDAFRGSAVIARLSGRLLGRNITSKHF